MASLAQWTARDRRRHVLQLAQRRNGFDAFNHCIRDIAADLLQDEELRGTLSIGKCEPCQSGFTLGNFWLFLICAIIVFFA